MSVEAAPAPVQEVPLLERIGRGRLVARARELAEMEAVRRRASAALPAVYCLCPSVANF